MSIEDKLDDLSEVIEEVFEEVLELELEEGHYELRRAQDELTLVVKAEDLLRVCKTLRERKDLAFEQCIDVCGVDYSVYGESEWVTNGAANSGFARGVDRHDAMELDPKNRFAAVYHLLSITHNWRLRVKTFLDADRPVVDSVVGVWSSASWFEREAFDLYGILFSGHPDLRRILTDYGFIGHPFRKDFPLVGQVEMRYDANQARVIYEPVNIEPRTLVPRVIREDSRYEAGQEQEEPADG